MYRSACVATGALGIGTFLGVMLAPAAATATAATAGATGANVANKPWFNWNRVGHIFRSAEGHLSRDIAPVSKKSICRDVC